MDDPDPALFSTITSTVELQVEDTPLDLDLDHETDFSATALHYIDQMLMEEDMDVDYNMFHDSLALQTTEKSFYDVLGQSYPPPLASIQHNFENYPNVESPEDSFFCRFSDYSTSSGSVTCSSSSSSAESHLNILDPTDYNPSTMPTTPSFPANFVSQSIWTNPSSTNDFFTTSSSELRQVVIKTEEVDDDAESEGTSYIQSAVNNVDDNELSELFDKVLLGTGLGKKADPNEDSSNLSSRGGKSRVRKHDSNEEAVGLRNLLMLCAQAVSSDNRSLANELLMQIKQNSSSTGDATQRLAHCFAIALEARLAGSGPQIYSLLSSKRPSHADMVKAHHVYSSACPFDKLAIIFSLNSICNVAKEAETLHIIDFGILYGFKWPGLISHISRRAGGPPKLRITGIELPLPGLDLHETGRCLARYCKRFNVPFEFNAIVAKKWESIKVEDLKINENECVAVNCKFRFKNLLDETVVLENPRDAVLDLIRKANPRVFVHGIVNGSYDAAFFTTRFKEAMFHYSALFDMLDSNFSRDDPMRLMFEKEIFGREVVNIVACEGCERVERPHTYKKWQLRNMRAGFRQLPLDQRIIEKLRARLRDDSVHSDFILHLDRNWVLQGWKGRVLHASSCWVPA